MVGPANRSDRNRIGLEDSPDLDDSTTPSGKPALDRAIQARIGDKLRAMYGELEDQPVPDRLVAILGRLGKD